MAARDLPAGAVRARAQPPESGYDCELAEEDALVELIRARLSGFGPLPVPLIARPLALPASAVALALTRLEAQGYVLRGRFTPGASEDEWCERHLLARIHRYTVKRLRREIEPVERADFMRFLADWQHLSAASRMQGREALDTLVEQLELPGGCGRMGERSAAGAPAGLWRQLAGRAVPFGAHRLDAAGRASEGRRGPVRGTPIVLLPRRQLAVWQALASGAPVAQLSSRAQRVLDCLQAHGALFFDELQHEAHLLRSELEDALGELVGGGAGERRQLRRPARVAHAGQQARAHHAAQPRRCLHRRHGGCRSLGAGAQTGGSEALADSRSAVDGEALEHIARVLLRRYGVVFWRLLAREADWLRPWREKRLRRMAALQRVAKTSWADASSSARGRRTVRRCRACLVCCARRKRLPAAPAAGMVVDSLNQWNTVALQYFARYLPGNRLLYRDGVPLAVLVAGKPQWLVELDMPEQEAVRRALLRH
ncbi:ATP-dependent DNA helicase OS=Stutzerimonas stutzeri OX=316 GN=CXK95_16760 PE=4 SV=1 [Stutzerimonas stutzeri]